MNTFYVTTPIYYANSLPHLGHLYTMIVCDSIARAKRQRGIDTYFLTGTDEHGINIERAAQKEGRTPQQQADYVVDYYKKMTREFGLDTEHGGYDVFMRTTAPFHYQGVSELWRRCAKAKTPKGNDAIYKGHYEGWFCAACAAYKTEDEYHKPSTPDGVPTCMVHDTPLDRISEESYFFRLGDYAEALLDLYETRPDFVRPESRRNEVMSFVRGGLQDLSVSRLKKSVSWGVPVPDDPDHTMYVWFDALTNYITAIGFGNEERERVAGFEKYWPALHVVGKDILRFHAVYWPSFLMAAGVELPRAIVAHGMWLDPNARKMSKTIGNTVELDVLQKHFSIDAIRYFCLREMVFGQDGRFGYEGLIDRSNSDLASGLGNLSSRTLTMIANYCGGKIPSGQIPEETTISGFLETARDQFLLNFENLAFSRALEIAWSVIARIDKMITEAKPWDLVKDENQKHTVNTVLYRAAETLRWLSVLLYPVMPDASRAIAKQLGLTEGPDKIDPASLKWGELREGTAIGDVQPIFPRIDKAKTMSEIYQSAGAPKPETSAPVPAAAPAAAASEAETSGVASFIEIDDFAKVDLRVGTVLSAERIPKADKLLLLKIDLNEEQPRQVLAGIAQYYEPESLIGRKVVVVANLKPRKLRGFESQGMVVAASYGEEGRPVIATFTEDVPNGARLK
ncbi:MAG TPA: methionine--tRNA ligase [Pyrinomonadaceae bacterium]|nr:methionine--tRNA ligase [Pyrinomonadaceae bacterium]